MDVDSSTLPHGAVEANGHSTELVAIKIIVGVMATMLARWREQAGGLSAESYVKALEEFCVDTIINTNLERSGDLGAHAFRLAVIKQVNAILYGTDVARDFELN